MTINGVSQTSGLQRLVDVSPAGDGLRLGIRDRKPGSAWTGVTVPSDALLAVLTEQPPGLQRIAGGEETVLDVEVRRNEVWLTIGGWDAAVGLDDLMDAVAGALPSS